VYPNFIDCSLQNAFLRKLITSPTQKQGLNSESNLEQRFLRSREKSELQSKTQGPKLYSKVLTIEPNRLLKILITAKLSCEFY